MFMPALCTKHQCYDLKGGYLYLNPPAYATESMNAKCNFFLIQRCDHNIIKVAWFVMMEMGVVHVYSHWQPPLTNSVYGPD